MSRSFKECFIGFRFHTTRWTSLRCPRCWHYFLIVAVSVVWTHDIYQATTLLVDWTCSEPCWAYSIPFLSIASGWIVSCPHLEVCRHPSLSLICLLFLIETWVFLYIPYSRESASSLSMYSFRMHCTFELSLLACGGGTFFRYSPAPSHHI